MVKEILNFISGVISNGGVVAFIKFTPSILSIGGVVAFINWIQSNRAEKRARKIAALEAQIKYLYGPLRFFTLQDEKCVEHTRKLSEAADSAFRGELSNASPDVQTRIDADISKTILIANEYADLVLANRERIMKILAEGYSYIEPDDVDLFGEVVLDYARHAVEGNKPAHERLPLSVSRQLDNIILMRQEFTARVRDRFNEKKKELDSHIAD